MAARVIDVCKGWGYWKMAVAWRRARTPFLDSQKWKVLTINGQQYLIKALFDDQGYHVMISDLSTIWEEDPGAEKILRRERSLNPNVEVPLPVLLSSLSSNIEDTPATASFTISPDPPLDSTPPDTLTLTLHTTLSSLPFKWEFICSKAPPKTLSSHLVEPLLCMVGELQRRQLELNKLLIKKDKEIQDYKDQGTVVSRRYLETVPFDARAFANEMITSSHFESAAQHPLAALSEPVFHELYRDIALVQNWAAKKDDFVPMEGGDLDSATTGTWAAKIPASLLPSVPPTSHTLSPTTAKSPEKSKPTSDEEDSEQERRETLKRKLEEEKSKAKKKKKKLI